MNVFRIIKFIAILLLLFFFVLVAVANKDPVTIKLLPVFTERFTLPPLPLSFILFMVFLFAILLVGLFAVFEMIKQNFKVSKLKKHNSLLEKEIANLRKEPLMSEGETSQADARATHNPTFEQSPESEDTLIKP